MDISDIKKAIAEFEAGLKPVKPGVTTLKAEAVEEAPPPGEVMPPAPPGQPCVSKDFKKVVQAFPDSWVGFDIKDIIVDFLETQIPECPAPMLLLLD